MKEIKIFTVIVAFSLFLVGCSGYDDRMPEGKTDDNTELKAETLSPDVPDNMYRVLYKYELGIYNFSQDAFNIDNLQVSVDIPDYMVNLNQNDNNCMEYVRYSKEIESYQRAFIFHPIAYKVEHDFVMDKSVHSLTDSDPEKIYGSVWSALEDYEVIKGKTVGGYDYVMYKKLFDRDFKAVIYIRISDEYIVEFTYSDEIENYDYLIMSVNSLKLVE